MALQFKVQLKNISDPPVWRTIIVPEQFTFFKLHKILQAAFGWENYHLFQFSPTGWASYPVIGVPDREFGAENIDAKKIKLSEIFTSEKQSFTYIYDFGDDWTHKLKLEKITDEKLKHARCLAAKGACPPEDCGGTWGYAQLKVKLTHPKHPEHASMKEWLGLSGAQTWDAAAADIGKINSLLEKI